MMICWAKMHMKNYDGTCANCGGRCGNQESQREWQKVINQLRELENYPYDSRTRKKINYLNKCIDEKRNYILGFK